MKTCCGSNKVLRHGASQARFLKFKSPSACCASQSQKSTLWKCSNLLSSTLPCFLAVGLWDLQPCHEQALLQQQAASEPVAQLVENALHCCKHGDYYKTLCVVLRKRKYRSCTMQAMVSVIHLSAAAKPLFWVKAVENRQHEKTSF